jgi:hypothetical protein
MSLRPSREALPRITRPTGSIAPALGSQSEFDNARGSRISLNLHIDPLCRSEGRFLSRSCYPANSRRSWLGVFMHNPALGVEFPGSTPRSDNRPSRTRVALPGSRSLPCCSRRASTPRDVNATPRSVIAAGSPVGLAGWFALSSANSGTREDRTTGLDRAEREVKTDPTRPTPAAPRTSARTKNTPGIPMNAPLG